MRPQLSPRRPARRRSGSAWALADSCWLCSAPVSTSRSTFWVLRESFSKSSVTRNGAHVSPLAGLARSSWRP